MNGSRNYGKKKKVKNDSSMKSRRYLHITDRGEAIVKSRRVSVVLSVRECVLTFRALTRRSLRTRKIPSLNFVGIIARIITVVTTNASKSDVSSFSLHLIRHDQYSWMMHWFQYLRSAGDQIKAALSVLLQSIDSLRRHASSLFVFF